MKDMLMYDLLIAEGVPVESVSVNPGDDGDTEVELKTKDGWGVTSWEAGNCELSGVAKKIAEIYRLRRLN